MKIKRLLYPILIALITIIMNFSPYLKNPALASEEQATLTELNEKIEKYQSELKKLNNQSNTLNNQLSQYDAQIKLTTLKIDQTKERIRLLGGRIDQLEVSLESLNQAFYSRVNETYRISRTNTNLAALLMRSESLSKAVSNFYYLKKIQEADKELLVRLESAQETYQSQKSAEEDLRKELDEQKSVLNNEKIAKAKLLAITRNDEKKYQDLLSEAKALRDAIQAIIAGKGDEIEVGDVKEGQRVADYISGPSTCSSGGHLHLEIVKDKQNINPSSYLIQKDIVWDNSPDSPFPFSGNWQWPLNSPIRITQGYGMTYYALQLRYYGGSPHTGIDMVNDSGDTAVKAVQGGVLYQGAISCSGGTLRYVRVVHEDGVSAYYLHINY